MIRMSECTGGSKLVIPADLSEASIEDAINQLRAKHCNAPQLLIVGEDDAFAAGKVCGKFNLSCVVLPREIIKRYAWLLAGEHSHIWSPGA